MQEDRAREGEGRQDMSKGRLVISELTRLRRRAGGGRERSKEKEERRE